MRSRVRLGKEDPGERMATAVERRPNAFRCSSAESQAVRAVRGSEASRTNCSIRVVMVRRKDQTDHQAATDQKKKGCGHGGKKNRRRCAPEKKSIRLSADSPGRGRVAS